MCNWAVLPVFWRNTPTVCVNSQHWSSLLCSASTQYFDQHLHDIAQNVLSIHKAPTPIIQDHFSFLSWSILLPKFLSFLKPYFIVVVVVVVIVIEAVTKML
jgi:hypothetical protein